MLAGAGSASFGSFGRLVHRVRALHLGPRTAMPPGPHPPNMPTAAQYARYRQDRTTIWVSKTAAAFLAREREHVPESVGTVLARLITELRRARRDNGGASGAATRGAARKGAGAKKSASKAGARQAG